ncbi:MarR family winged helix-turn-helix transcriptional regulator [Aquipuribacter hungaricus]|uniref:MarR family winged helix-turn-helix transcriptional regulator n=1 Tax=Aquipuribacter hungaricus TaxID=545624 RepID=A0ABV7WIN4_9MICO
MPAQPPAAVEAVVAVDDMLCLALHTAARSMTARYRPALAALGLTYPQYLVMVLLWQEGEASVGRIGSRLGLESSTLSPLLKRLEAAGLVTRVRSRTDERSVTVALTDRGSSMRAEAAHLPAEVCEQAGLDEGTQADLVVRLRALVEQLERSGSATRPA